MDDTDKRLEFLQNYTLMSLRLKLEKWTKFLSVDEYKQQVVDFLSLADSMVLVISTNPAGQLYATSGFPAILKNKGVYFVKKNKETITKDNIKTSLIVGDTSSTPVEQLMSVVEEVVYTLFMNGDNLSGWPRVVTEDIMTQAHRLKNEIFVMEGKMKGKTLLSLPEHLDKVDISMDADLERPALYMDSALLHAIETVIIDWSHQIRDVLSKDSAQPLLDGLNPLPAVEIDFWNTRLLNLEYINEQLLMPRAYKVSEILEKARSSYWPALQNIYKDLDAGLKEAKDIVLYLKPFQIRLDEIEQTEFPQVLSMISGLMYTVCFIWANSQHYSTPSRIIVLLQEICNFFIEMIRTFLGAEEIMKGLQGEIEESVAKIQLVVKVLQRLYSTYNYCCSEMHLFFKDKEVRPWDFPLSLIFSRMDGFSHRIKTIEELYFTAVEFLKLEKIEMGGVRGKALGSLVNQIYEEFLELLVIFADCKYDPLDPGQQNFYQDYQVFQTKVEDLDRRLGTIISQGFEDCSSIESAVKLLHMFGSLLDRPFLAHEVLPKYSALLEMFDKELDLVKIIYDAQVAASEASGGIPPISKNMAPVAGQLKWALELQQRLQASKQNLDSISHPVMSGDEAKLVFNKYEEMMVLLQKYSENTYSKWTDHVDEESRFNLQQPIIVRDPKTQLLSVNFNKEDQIRNLNRRCEALKSFWTAHSCFFFHVGGCY